MEVAERAELTELRARMARVERILSRVLDKRRECAIMELAEIEDSQGMTRTIPNREQRKAAAYEQKRQG